jgi:hypothetical protein
MRILSYALLAAGAVLTFVGINQYHSVSSGVSRLFTGAPPDEVVWMLAGGAAAIVAGLAGLSSAK